MAAALVFLGAGLVVAGVAFVYWPAAVVVAGVLLVVGGLLIDFDEGEE